MTSGSPNSNDIHTVVIGGGQAGLAAGYFLSSHNVPFVILDAHERIGDSWRNRWDSLRLFTPARYSSLPGMEFPATASHRPNKDEMADYLEGYAARFGLPVELGTEVVSVRSAGAAFDVATRTDRIRANCVIVASGFDNQPRIPGFASDLDEDIFQAHSKEYRNPSQLRRGGVLVVGAGNSGAEIALELANAGHAVWLSGRDPGQEPTRDGTFVDRLLTPIMWFAANHVVTVDTAIGRSVRRKFLEPPRGIPRGRVRMKDIAGAGIERLPRTTGVEDGKPVVDGGRVLDVANVIWCTGYTPGFDWLDLPLRVKHGVPEHERGVLASVPGLYFVGLYFQYALSSPLVGGVGRDARYVVDHLVSKVGVPSTV